MSELEEKGFEIDKKKGHFKIQKNKKMPQDLQDTIKDKIYWSYAFLQEWNSRMTFRTYLVIE